MDGSIMETIRVSYALIMPNGTWYDIPAEYAATFIALAESYGLEVKPYKGELHSGLEGTN